MLLYVQSWVPAHRASNSLCPLLCIAFHSIQHFLRPPNPNLFLSLPPVVLLRLKPPLRSPSSHIDSIIGPRDPRVSSPELFGRLIISISLDMMRRWLAPEVDALWALRAFSTVYDGSPLPLTSSSRYFYAGVSTGRISGGMRRSYHTRPTLVVPTIFNHHIPTLLVTILLALLIRHTRRIRRDSI